MTFPRFFNAEELGKSLKEVATDLVMTTHQDVISRWFHSSKDADLFIWLDLEQNVIKQQISFYGQVVEWNIVEGLKTGLVIEEESADRRQNSEVVQFDERPQQTPIDQAVALLDHITALQDGERQMLVRNFRQFSGLSTTMPAEMFIERFGRYLQRPQAKTTDAPIAAPSLWQRLTAWARRK